MRILVTGGTGFIGRALCGALSRAGHQLRVPSRSAARARSALPGVDVLDLPTTPVGWSAAVDGCDAIVNLAGESIAAGRWTAARKARIVESRVGTTRSLVAACSAAASRPAALVSASAIGYYGDRGADEVTEATPPGSDFLAEVCKRWEAEALAAEKLGMRVVLTRLGVVLAEDGGALERMKLPFKLMIGGPLGNGRQWLSWIHRDDAVGLITLALETAVLKGALNLTSPDPRTMHDFAKSLGRALHRPSWLPVPELALRLALGEMAQMLLVSQRVLPVVAQKMGHAFRFAALDDALAAVVA